MTFCFQLKWVYNDGNADYIEPKQADVVYGTGLCLWSGSDGSAKGQKQLYK